MGSNINLHRFRINIGKKIFKEFFPNENKRLNQKQGIGKQPDLVLVSVPSGKITQASTAVRTITGWSVKKSNDFIKKGTYPKVVIYDVKSDMMLNEELTLVYFIEGQKSTHNIIFEIY